MAKSTAYSCPQCGAALKLDPSTGMLGCDYCGGQFSVDQIEELIGSRREDHQEARKSEAVNGGQAVDWADWHKYKEQLSKEQFTDVVTYHCTNCGAEVIADKNTVATTCQYCDSSVVADPRVSGGLKPAYVIPFKVKKEDLPGNLQAFYKNRPLLPDDFFSASKMEKVQGLYVPFWLFDGKVEGSITYDCTNSSSYTSGDYDVTETSHYDVERGGEVNFVRIPVDASERMDDDMMDSLEPFDYKELVPFQAGYLTGFVAERFDKDPDEVFDRATLRMGNSAQSVLTSTVKYDTVTMKHNGLVLRNAALRYVMLPVYVFNTSYMGKKYQFAVNGQTGKIIGEVPTSRRKAFMTWLKGMALGTGIGAVILGIVWFLGM